VLLHYRAPALSAVSFSISEGVDPSTISSPSIFVTRWTSRLLASRIPALGSSWGSCRSVPLLPEATAVLSSDRRCRSQSPSSSSGIATACHLDTLFPPILHGKSENSNWAALLSGLLAQPWPGCSPFWWRLSCAMPLLHSWLSLCGRRPIDSGVHTLPWSVPVWRCLACAVPLLRDGTPSYQRRSIFSGIHKLPGSFPSASSGAPRPDSSPSPTSSVLWAALLRLLAWGPIDAPLRTASFMDRAQSPLYLPLSLHGFLETLCHG
jgi:hypothetical protein